MLKRRDKTVLADRWDARLDEVCMGRGDEV